MRVLIPLGLFYPSRLGGPANTLYWLSKALVRSGVEITVITTNNYIDSKDIEFDKWIEIDGIRVRYCTTRSKLSFKIIWYSLKEVKKNDFILFSSICYLPNFFILLYSLLFKSNIIWSPRGELFDSALKGNKFKLLYFRILKCLSRRKVIFHATSEEEKSCILKYFPNFHVVVIPNYMELPLKVNRKVSNIPYLLYVGRIAPIKALDSLIVGLAHSKQFVESDFIFKIVGDVEEQFSSYYEELITLINNKGLSGKVFFVGSKYGYEKYQCFANAYFSFLLSNSENFGNVVIEALSQGTPVVASKGTPWETLKDNNAGFWIQNDVNTISNCIDNILSLDENDYQGYRNNAYMLSKQFDVNSNVWKWKELFESIKRK